MPIPVTYTLYCNTSSFPGTTYGGLSTNVPPPLTNTTIGWNVGTLTPPRFCELNYGIEVNRNSTQWQTSPTASTPNRSAGGSGGGNCWMSGPYSGEFIPGTWTMAMTVKAVSNASAHDGRFVYRIWSSPTGSGENARLLSTNYISSSVVTVNSTTVPKATTSSFTMPYILLRNEYLLIQTYWSIVTAAGNNNADNDYVLGTGSFIQPTSFVSQHTKMIIVGSEDDY